MILYAGFITIVTIDNDNDNYSIRINSFPSTGHKIINYPYHTTGLLLGISSQADSSLFVQWVPRKFCAGGH